MCVYVCVYGLLCKVDCTQTHVLIWYSYTCVCTKFWHIFYMCACVYMCVCVCVCVCVKVCVCSSLCVLREPEREREKKKRKREILNQKCALNCTGWCIFFRVSPNCTLTQHTPKPHSILFLEMPQKLQSKKILPLLCHAVSVEVFVSTVLSSACCWQHMPIDIK